MKQIVLQYTLLFSLFVSRGGGKILRNNALMSKMVLDFRAPQQTRVVDIMKNVLCKHFPAIPCQVITKDVALKTLIQRTVELMSDKQRSFQNATEAPIEQRPGVPVINSEELSHYLAVENTGYFTDSQRNNIQNNDKHVALPKTVWSDDVVVDRGQNQPRTDVPARKNIRKYFPHKIKYKDMIERNELDNSREKPSASEEVPDTGLKKRVQHYRYKKEPRNMPMWQIDYTKHGEPRLPSFSREIGLLKGKLAKVTADTENTVLKHRKSVLHPNVYIKSSSKREMNY